MGGTNTGTGHKFTLVLRMRNFVEVIEHRMDSGGTVSLGRMRERTVIAKHVFASPGEVPPHLHGNQQHAPTTQTGMLLQVGYKVGGYLLAILHRVIIPGEIQKDYIRSK